MHFLKKIITVGILGGIFYVLLSYHFIVINNSVKLLKKSSLTLQYTFFNTTGKQNETILAVDELRWDGIGDLLVETGKLSEEEMERIVARIEKEEEE